MVILFKQKYFFLQYHFICWILVSNVCEKLN